MLVHLKKLPRTIQTLHDALIAQPCCRGELNEVPQNYPQPFELNFMNLLF